MKVMEQKAYTFEIKAINEAGEFEGYASTFGNIDLHGDVMMSGAFAETIKAGKMPLMLFGHDMNEPVGEFLTMQEFPEGLKMTGKLWINQGIPNAQKAYGMMNSKAGAGMSVGGFVTDQDVTKDGNRAIKGFELMEVSIVTFPANPAAGTTMVKSLINDDGEIVTKRQFEKILRDAGLPNELAKAFIAGGYNAAFKTRDADDAAAKALDVLSNTLKNVLAEIERK